MKKILLIIGILILVLAGLAALVVFWIFTAREMPVTERDKALIVSANELAPYFEGFSPQPQCEVLKRLKYLDGMQELTYEYDAQMEGEPYVKTTITYDVKPSDALMTYSIEWSAQAVTFKVYGMYLEENSTFYNPDGKSKFGNIIYEGEPVGHVFVYQKENTVMAFTISGFIMRDPQIWHDLFDHRIEAL